MVHCASARRRAAFPCSSTKVEEETQNGPAFGVAVYNGFFFGSKDFVPGGGGGRFQLGKEKDSTPLYSQLCQHSLGVRVHKRRGQMPAFSKCLLWTSGNPCKQHDINIRVWEMLHSNIGVFKIK